MTLHRRDRAALIADVRDRLMRDSMPRLTMLAIVTGAGGAAFLTAVWALGLGVESMALRYLLASVVGYAAFTGLIRGWIAFRRNTLEAVADSVDVADIVKDVALSAPTGPPPAPVFLGGGSSGGAGVSGGWQGPAAPMEAGVRGSAGRGAGDIVGAADEGWWLVVAAAMAAGGLVAVLYVIYAAPILLAEVALDAALFSAVYRQLRKEDLDHWLGAVWRRTRWPAAALIAFMTALGYALQRAVPDARSIGDVLRALAG